MPTDKAASLPEDSQTTYAELATPLAPWWAAVTPPTAYCTHPETGELVGRTSADPSPLEPDVWITPANAYLDEPPASASGKAIVRKGGKWSLVEDHRGATVYSTADGAPVQWTALGKLPASVTLTAPGEFDEWKDGSWQEDQTAKQAAARDAATMRRTLLMQYAGAQIGALQDAVDLEIANDREVAALKAWKTYRVQLNRIDLATSVPTADGWPTSPDDASVNAWLSAQGIATDQDAKSAA